MHRVRFGRWHSFVWSYDGMGSVMLHWECIIRCDCSGILSDCTAARPHMSSNIRISRSGLSSLVPCACSIRASMTHQGVANSITHAYELSKTNNGWTHQGNECAPAQIVSKRPIPIGILRQVCIEQIHGDPAAAQAHDRVFPSANSHAPSLQRHCSTLRHLL